MQPTRDAPARRLAIAADDSIAARIRDDAQTTGPDRRTPKAIAAAYLEAAKRVTNYDRPRLIDRAKMLNAVSKKYRMPTVNLREKNTDRLRVALLNSVQAHAVREVLHARAKADARWKVIQDDSTSPYQPPATTVQASDRPAPRQPIKSSKELRAQARRKLKSLVPSTNTRKSDPIYVRAVGNILADGTTRRTPEDVFTRIRTHEDIRNYIASLVSRLLPYTLVSNSTNAQLTSVDIEVQLTADKQRVLRVADHPLENCVVNLIRSTARDVDALYQKFPQFAPVDDRNNPRKVYVGHDDLHTLAKHARLNIVTYTKLGSITNQPWGEYGLKKRKQLHIVVHNEHATLRLRGHKIDCIEYHANLVIPRDTNVIEYDYYVFEDDQPQPDRPAPPRVPKYYLTYADKLVTMHKSFRPSSITANADDDSATRHAYVFTDEQMMYELFKLKYNLTVASTPEVRHVVKRAEHFIGRQRIADIAQDAVEFDHNKNYVAYETLPEYVGFPTGALVPATLANANSPAFYIVTIPNPPACLTDLLRYTADTQIVITAPMYTYLSTVTDNIHVDYVLDGKRQHVSIADFADSFNLPDNSKKLFRNTLIGRTITGGLANTKTVHYDTTVPTERQQIVHEAQQNGYRCAENATGVVVELEHAQSKQLYDFHSYILGYAAIHMMRKYTELAAQQHTIAAWCVDAIVVNPNPNTPIQAQHDAHIGGWKTSEPKPYYSQMQLRGERQPGDGIRIMFGIEPEPAAPLPLPEPIHNVTPPARRIPVRNTIITGAAGVGKSHIWKTSPAYDQIMLAPTHELVREHREQFENTFTAAKYFQFGVDDDVTYNLLRAGGQIPPKHSVIVIDELSMFSAAQWKVILRRSKGSIIIALGDFEQIQQCIDSYPVTPQYFVDKGFDITHIERTPDTHARHAYEFGWQLDRLRGQSISTQKRLISRLIGESRPFDITAASPTDRVIVGTHEQARAVHALARKAFTDEPFPFKRRTKKGYVIEYLPVTTPGVWWGREKQTDTPPKGLTREPAFAVTADSYQGKTTDDFVYVMVDSLVRPGCLYTAVTRTRTANQMVACECI